MIRVALPPRYRSLQQEKIQIPQRRQVPEAGKTEARSSRPENTTECSADPSARIHVCNAPRIACLHEPFRPAKLARIISGCIWRTLNRETHSIAQ